MRLEPQHAALEGLILGNLARHRGRRAIIMVAHRRTTLKWAKRTFMLDAGRLNQIDGDPTVQGGASQRAVA